MGKSQILTFADLLSDAKVSSKNKAISKIVKTTSRQRKFESLDGKQPVLVPNYVLNGRLVKFQATNGVICNNVFGKKVFVSDEWISTHFPTWYVRDEEGKPTLQLVGKTVPTNMIRNRVIAIKVEPQKELAKIEAEKRSGGNQKQLDAEYDRKTKQLIKSGLKKQPYFAVSKTNLQGMTCSTVDKMPALEAFGLI